MKKINKCFTIKEKQTEMVIIGETTLQSKIHTVRGQKVMLDFELAEIYGYTTKAFNQQVKNNEERFDEDFRFKLTREEVGAVPDICHMLSQNKVFIC